MGWGNRRPTTGLASGKALSSMTVSLLRSILRASFKLVPQKLVQRCSGIGALLSTPEAAVVHV